MNKWIKKELLKCSVADLPEFNDDTKEIFIPKHQGIVIKKDKCYLIKIDKTKLDSSITINYNNNIEPKYDYYKMDVNQIIGKMVNLNGIAYDYNNKEDLNNVWSGWLPINTFTIIEEI